LFGSLSISDFKITAILSVTHRGTGIALAGMMMGAAAGSLFLPMPFPEALAIVQVTNVTKRFIRHFYLQAK